jgi:DNA-binding transcriptional LysR family regulator
VEFRQIRYALAVAKERSFTKAAKRVHISQSAVSDQVRLLEQDIGFALFKRTPQGIDVTDRGRTFLYEAERVASDLLSLSDTAKRLKGATTDTLTVGMGSGMAEIFMPRLFPRLNEILPGVRLELVTAPTKNIFNELHEERIDVGLAIETDPDRLPAGLVLSPLTTAEMVLIVSPKHALARSRGAVDVGRLVAEPVIMSDLSLGYGQAVLSMFADLGMRPNILAIADNIETIKVIVQSGKGIAFVPRACVANETGLGVLKVLPIAPARRVALAFFRRRQPLSRRKEEFLSALYEALKD